MIGQALHGKGQISLMSLSPTATTQVQRLQGVKDELKASYPGISVVSTQYTQQAPTSSETTARSVLSAHPGIGAFFGAAEPNAEGTAQALVSTGKRRQHRIRRVAARGRAAQEGSELGTGDPAAAARGEPRRPVRR